MWDVGFGMQGLGFRMWDVGFGMWDVEIGIWERPPAWSCPSHSSVALQAGFLGSWRDYPALLLPGTPSGLAV